MPASRCPTCRASIPEAERGSAFPFCSERCRLADLGSWLDERFVIPGTVEDDAIADDDGGRDGPAPAYDPRRTH